MRIDAMMKCNIVGSLFNVLHKKLLKWIQNEENFCPGLDKLGRPFGN